MPLVTINLSVKVEDESKLAKFESEVSKAVSAVLSKPEEWMMVETHTNVRLHFAGSNAPSARLSVQSIGGLTPENNAKITAALTKTINEHFQIDPKRVYVLFSQKTGAEWGWNDIVLNIS
ncbi:hypothetical protein HW132_36515 [Brasilonema sp. CT11]|nr:hypothetical protein [Brasilonema sp. CT11]